MTIFWRELSSREQKTQWHISQRFNMQQSLSILLKRINSEKRMRLVRGESAVSHRDKAKFIEKLARYYKTINDGRGMSSCTLLTIVILFFTFQILSVERQLLSVHFLGITFDVCKQEQGLAFFWAPFGVCKEDGTDLHQFGWKWEGGVSVVNKVPSNTFPGRLDIAMKWISFLILFHPEYCSTWYIYFNA